MSEKIKKLTTEQWGHLHKDYDEIFEISLKQQEEIERQNNLNKQLVDECQRFEDKIDTLKIEISSLMSRYFYEKNFQIEDTHLDKLLRIIDNDVELKGDDK